MSNNEENKKRRLLTGVVISKKMMKTASVKVQWLRQNKRVKKVERLTRKVQVHDPLEQARVGDVIDFYEGRPISKSKCMYFNSVVKQNKGYVDFVAKDEN